MFGSIFQKKKIIIIINNWYNLRRLARVPTKRLETTRGFRGSTAYFRVARGGNEWLRSSGPLLLLLLLLLLCGNGRRVPTYYCYYATRFEYYNQ